MVSKSSTEAEYRAVTYTIAKTIWIHKLLHDIGISFVSATKVFYDNISASYMMVNLVQHDRSKHITVDYHFVCERVAQGDPVVRYIPTQL